MVDLADGLADAIGLRAAMSMSMDLDVDVDADVVDVDVDAVDVDVDVDPMQAIRARLAARGLLHTQPAVVVPKEARRLVPAPEPEVDLRPERHWSEAVEDDWDVEPGRDEMAVRCPQCREVYELPLESTRLRCAPCDRAWRWAVCGGCDALALTVERQESWRCASCGHFTRSWWRTPAARRDALHVVTRRKHVAMEQERVRVRAGMRKRRWKLVAFAAVAAIAAVVMVVGVRAAEPSDANGSDAVCAHVARIGPDFSKVDTDHEVAQLQAEAAGATPDIAKAVDDLRAAGAPGTSAFLVARTGLVDACTRAGF